MKTKLLLIVFSFTLIAFSSCKKETGPAGPAGADGKDGNANVKAFMFLNPITSGRAWVDTLPGVTYKSLDSALLLTYIQDYNCGPNWYNAPGMGCLADYSMRVYTQASSSTDTSTQIDLALYNPDGSYNAAFHKTFTKIRVIVAYAPELLYGKKEMDYSNYSEVCRYFNIAE